ncbi:MAG: hypothetical protein Q9161_009822 [Pseudevernia consocians]
MDSQNPNRNTQFEMEGLTGLEQSTPLPEPEGHLIAAPQRLQDRQVLKKNAAKRKSIRHDHIVTVLETFRFEGSFYVVLERMAISLVQIVASPPYPGKQELAAILGQV